MKSRLIFAIVIMAVVLTACNSPIPFMEGNVDRCGDKSKLAEEISLYIWGQYVYPGIKVQFEEECGVKVTEINFDSNEDMLAKLQSGATYDIVAPSDYMVQIMIDDGLLMPLDYSVIPNMKNMAKMNVNQYFDPEQKYSVPYFWGTSGFAVDTSVVKEYEPSWKMLFDPNSPYCGKITMLDDERETISVALIYLGYSINDTDPAHLEQAKNLLIEQAKCVKVYDSRTNDNMMIYGEIALAHMWTGDALAAGDASMGGRAEIVYVIPKEGAAIWQDNLAIPVNAPNAYTAMVFINYLNYPDVAAQNAEWVGYGTPNLAAKRVMAKEILADESIYPPPEVEARLQWMQDVGEAAELYHRIWAEVKAVVENK
ncbi:MAG TPA: spermidine/putrescine ABC transporter substrate-binding protein [Anaerolineales bacterium]|nr:spermidine/putrescine ABC transporter substrate-binding protein [Anaerolineales bacterium]